VKAVRRFVGIGVLATVIDVVLLFVGVRAFGWSVPVADLFAIAVATLVSYVGHRLVTFSADPARRWYGNPIQYVATALFAAGVDIALLTLATGGRSDVSNLGLLLGKAVSLGVAFLVRSMLYRRWMFEEVREDQQAPVARPTPPGEVRLSVVIPAFREEDGIAATVARVRDELAGVAGDGGLELVVVDDGSPDDTAARAREAGADQVVRLEPNQGKGAAVRAGVLAARGRCIAFTDADLSYAPSQILGLLERIEQGWDVVVGSRKHTETTTLVAARRLREVGGRVINLLTSVVLLGQYRDTQCGLKAFRSDVGRVVFEHSHIDGFAFDVEVFHLVERYRLTLCEVPVEVVNSARSTVRVVRDAARLVRDLFRIRRMGRAGGYEVDDGDWPATLVGRSEGADYDRPSHG
jgi:dolichyl-phosphate beta-glucosyltransferase